jgi:hypothetical protein
VNFRINSGEKPNDDPTQTYKEIHIILTLIRAERVRVLILSKRKDTTLIQKVMMIQNPLVDKYFAGGDGPIPGLLSPGGSLVRPGQEVQ